MEGVQGADGESNGRQHAVVEAMVVDDGAEKVAGEGPAATGGVSSDSPGTPAPAVGWDGGCSTSVDNAAAWLREFTPVKFS